MKFYYLGNFDSSGKSSLLNTNINADEFIDDIIPSVNSLLPEGYKMHHLHPEWLKDNSLDFHESTEVVITFVSEGAGYRNSIGYFIYPTANPPKTIGHIKECYFFYPNSSLSGSGGSLNAGDRIKLPFTFNYSAVDGREIVTPNNYVFQNGHSIAFILYPNGWTGSGVNKYITPYTSLSDHNPEKARELKFHTACFLIPGTQRLLLSFEDIRRDKASCDHDFNDAVMIIETDLSSVSKSYTNTKELEDEKDDPNIPQNFTIGYKKVYSSMELGIVEAVATLYIPRGNNVVTKGQYIQRLIASESYIKNIVVVPPKTGGSTTNRYVGNEINSGYSWYDNSFTYQVGQTVIATINQEQNSGIHFFRSFAEGREYDFTPGFGL
jgi:hypothetical protein